MKFKQAATDQRLEEAADKRLQENIHSEIDSIVLAFTAKMTSRTIISNPMRIHPSQFHLMQKNFLFFI